MLEPINLLRYSKYGFLTSMSALLSFIASHNSTAKSILVYVLVAAIVLCLIAFFMRRNEVDSEGRALYLLSDIQRFEILTIVSLFVLGVIAGVS